LLPFGFKQILKVLACKTDRLYPTSLLGYIDANLVVLSQIHLPRQFVMLVPQICVDGSESYEHTQVEEEGGYVEHQSQQPDISLSFDQVK